jgi:hypothetical protein
MRAMASRLASLCAYGLAALAAGVTPCAAQTADQPALFLGAGALAGIERRAHTDFTAPAATSENLNATVPVGLVTVGSFLTPHVSVSLEVAVPGDLSASFSPPVSSFSTSPTSPGPSEHVSGTYRSRAASVLVGYHAARQRRVRLGYLAGAAFVYERERVVTELNIPGVPPVVPTRVERTDGTSFTYRAALAAGADADVVLSRHFALVPQVRAIAFAGMISLRPGLSVRWNR